MNNVYLDVMKFSEVRGIYELTVDDYWIMPEDSKGFLNKLKEIKKRHGFNLELLSVECKPCRVNYKDNSLVFPQFGKRAHITEVLFGDTAYCDIVDSESGTVDQFIERYIDD